MGKLDIAAAVYPGASSFTSLRFDYYYSLNDDVLMKDILAGVYTGVPESRNVQMLYPLSLLLSLLVKVFHTSYVYGIFLCLCQFGSLYLILYRSMRYGKKQWERSFCAFWRACFLPAFCFLTWFCAVYGDQRPAGSRGDFLVPDRGSGGVSGHAGALRERERLGLFCKRNLPAVLLCVLAFCCARK